MQSSVLILTTETLLSLGISAVVLYLLQPVLQALLQEICHGKTRALFWSTFTRLMLLISPLLVVLLYSHSLSAQDIGFAQVFRDALLHSLFGEFIGLLIVGGVLLRFSSRDSGTRAQPLPAWPPEGEH